MAKTWDNFDYFELEDMKQAQFEAKLPRCDICGEPMTEWLHVKFHLMDVKICENCAEWEYYEED